MRGKLKKLSFVTVILVLAQLFAVTTLFAGERFTVEANLTRATADAKDQFEYDPETGKLYRLNTAEQPVEIKSFGEIPNLSVVDIEILASDFANEGKTAKPALLVIRHGNWVSIIDPVTDKAIMSNLGPFESSDHAAAFRGVMRLPSGEYVVAFTAEAIHKSAGKTTPRTYLFLFNSMTGSLSWLPVRTDASPIEIKGELMAPNFVKVAANFNVPVVTKNSQGEPERSVMLMSGELLIDLKTGKVVQGQGASLVASRILKEVDMTSLTLSGPHKPEMLFRALGTTASPQTLLETGNRRDSKARSVAIAKANEEINVARGVETHIRESMAGILGQEEVVEKLVKGAQAQLEAKGHAVYLLGGPSGVGKTSGFSAFIKGFLKAVGIESKEPLLEIAIGQIEGAQFVESFLFGSKPPYIGANTPSNFVLWLLNNSDGGAVLFDEIDKAKPEVLEKMMSFLEKGEVKLTPYLVESLCEYYKSTPKDAWPKLLRQATNDGKNTQNEIVVKLTNKHFIGLATNIGGDNFGDNGQGKELTSEQDLIQANKRFTEETLRKAMKGVYKAEVVNRITSFFPFKKILKKDHAKIVDLRIADVEKQFAKKLIDFEFTDAARKFLQNETFDPSAGARNIERQIDQWISQNVNDAVVGKRLINPGDRVVVDVKEGNGLTVASMLKLEKHGEGKVLAEYTVGKPLPPNNLELLERARKNLVPTLERRIVGHRGEIQLLAKAIIGELAEAAANPKRQGRPVVIYFDGTPGIGKTEIAKAVAEALFDDAGRLTRVDFQDIVDMNTFYKYGIDRMKAGIKTNPESQVMLWDELHRIADSPYKQMIENTLLNAVDEGMIPMGPEAKEKLAFAPATIVIATGNLLARALGPRAHSMTNNELQAQVRLLMRHPESYMAVFAKTFGEAFRSRLGQPLLFTPLTDEEVELLRDRFFEEFTKVLKDQGINAELSESAKKFFSKEYVPMEGGRWLRRTMKMYVGSALTTLVIGSQDRYRGMKFEITWNEEKRALEAQVKKAETLVETFQLADVPRTKSDYHPDSRERAAWKTSVHEAGHALVTAVLEGPEAVAEINTFGGGEGGWMEKNFNAPGVDMYYTTKSGIKNIAISLAGHLAERKLIRDKNGEPVTANGASSDYENARRVAQTMLIDGSFPDIAPISLITNPSTGQIDMSNEKKLELERKVDFIMEYAGWIANRILEKNEAKHLELAKRLHGNKNMHMGSGEFREIMTTGQKLVELSAKEMDSARKYAATQVDNKSKMNCTALLTKAEAVPPAKTNAFKWFWQRILFWLGIRR